MSLIEKNIAAKALSKTEQWQFLSLHIYAPMALETLTNNIGSVEMALAPLQVVKGVNWELLGAVAERSKAGSSDRKKACDLFYSSTIALLVQ